MDNHRPSTLPRPPSSGSEPDWDGSAARLGLSEAAFFALSIRGPGGAPAVYLALNASPHPVTASLPPSPVRRRARARAEGGKGGKSCVALEGACRRGVQWTRLQTPPGQRLPQHPSSPASCWGLFVQFRHPWRRAVDTALPAPEDAKLHDAPRHPYQEYTLQPGTGLLLVTEFEP